MRPHTICHMVSSIDGRTLGSRWSPSGIDMGALFEGVHDRLGGGSWIVGRTTGQEFAKGEDYPQASEQTFAREPFIAKTGAEAYGIVLDAHGKIAWGRADVGGDPIVVVLTEAVSDEHLAGLRSDGVSYVFAGKNEIDLALALETLGRELELETLLIEGGGGANGALLRAGLVDEISVVIAPAVDGAEGAPSVFNASEAAAGEQAPVEAIELVSHEVIEGGAVWLRYRVTNR
jgi:riboflavin biosynthesis pyrimidine reductase